MKNTQHVPETPYTFKNTSRETAQPSAESSPGPAHVPCIRTADDISRKILAKPPSKKNNRRTRSDKNDTTPTMCRNPSKKQSNEIDTSSSHTNVDTHNNHEIFETAPNERDAAMNTATINS